MSDVKINSSQVDDPAIEVFVAKINSYISATVSLIGNILVLCLVNVKRDRPKFSINSTSIIYVSISAIVFSVNCVLSCPMIHIHSKELLIINNGILKNVLLGRLSLCIFAFFVLSSAMFSATSLFLKYMAICRNQFVSNKKLHMIYSIQCLVAMVWMLTFANAVWFQHAVILDNHQHPLKGRPALFATMDQKSLTLSLSLLMVLLISAIALMLFCSQRITATINTLQDHRHKNLQKRTFCLLLVQTGLPFLLLHVPILLEAVLPVKYIADLLLDSLSLLYSWYPACIPFVVLWNLRTKLASVFTNYATNKA
ncbi:hypothetical protein KIN20_031257 [Parelaphostrongylus tenuis]|uniref:Uncharacterized protein n=1 Tax=Parelaphostrongylus tenuis TaxID=148309 RepID=A0AAD5R4V8_PARTN|nr:hypothetical protein KIN20_031257 [Parelaphostrongylus tenuis]